MSEVSTKTARAVDVEQQSPESAASHSTSKPVLIWATFGGALLVLQVWVWARWITGPYFTRVPTGVSDPPTYMKVPLIANAAILWAALPVALWWFFIKPWRRDRRIGLDGLLVLSTGLMFFQDPLLNYLNTWCTYNTWLFNRGSWSALIPGAVSPEAPGRQVAEPLLTNIPGYAYGVVLITIVGCAFMRKIQSRWPNISVVRLILIAYGFDILLDFLMEGCLLLPIGFYSYPGAIRAVSINAGHYYQWPVYEGLMWGGVQTALCCLRYFTDDNGRTVVERGLDRIGGGVVRQQFVRFLALFAGASTCFFVFYNVPAQWFGMHADPWPTDVQKRSYLNGGICGAGSDQPCPNPALPLPTKRSGFIDNDGRLVLPPGAQLPTVVPFQHGR